MNSPLQPYTLLLHRNRSPGSTKLQKPRPVIVYQCLRFVRLSLVAIAPLCAKAQTGEDEVLVNDYPSTKITDNPAADLKGA